MSLASFVAGIIRKQTPAKIIVIAERLSTNPLLLDKYKDMNEINLLRTFFTISLQNIKVTLGIYIQALKLFFKGAKYINRPKISKTKFTVINERR